MAFAVKRAAEGGCACAQGRKPRTRAAVVFIGSPNVGLVAESVYAVYVIFQGIGGPRCHGHKLQLVGIADSCSVFHTQHWPCLPIKHEP